MSFREETAAAFPGEKGEDFAAAVLRALDAAEKA